MENNPASNGTQRNTEFVHQTSDKGLKSKIYKELIQFNKKKHLNQKKMAWIAKLVLRQ